MTDIASLGLRVDSTQAAVAADDLTRLASASQAAEESAVRSTGTFSRVGSEFQKLSAHARLHVLRLADASEGTRAFVSILSRLPLPLAAVGAVLAAVSVAYAKGHGEASAFTRAIESTGNAAGVSVNQLKAYAGEVAKVEGNTHEASEALAALVATGKVGKEHLVDFAAVAVQAQRALGQSVEDTTKQFVELAEQPLEVGASLRLLTPALYDEIRALQQQGKNSEAATKVQVAYAASLKEISTKAEESAGFLSKLWTSVKQGTSDVGNFFLGIGRAEGDIDRLRELQQKRGSRPLGTLIPGFDTTQQLLDDRVERILTARVAKQKELADATKKTTDANAEYVRSQEKSIALAQAELDLGKERFTTDIQRIQSRLSASLGAGKNADEILEAQHDALLIRDTAFFDAKRRLLEKDAATQENALRAEIERVRIEGDLVAQRLANLQKLAAKNPADVVNLQAQADADRLQRQRQIAASEAKIAELRAQTTARVSVLDIQSTNNLTQLKIAYDAAAASANRYVDSLQRQFDLETRGLGAGKAERDRLSQRQAIEDQFRDRIQSLEDDLRRGDITKERFDEFVKIEQDALKRSEGAFDRHYDELQNKQSQWLVGAKEAFHNYIDTARNSAALTEEAYTNTFQALEDSIVNFVKTGKFSFADLATSIIVEIARIETKILISSVLRGIFGGGGAGPLSGSSGVGSLVGGSIAFAAAGASASAGQPFIVGEKGPELFVPSAAGQIVPNGAMGGRPVINVVNNIDARHATTDFIDALPEILQRNNDHLKSDILMGLHRGEYPV